MNEELSNYTFVKNSVWDSGITQITQKTSDAVKNQLWYSIYNKTARLVGNPEEIIIQHLKEK